LPKPQGEGAALSITGTDMSSINAGGHFLTEEKAVARLLQFLKVGAREPVPYFEVLLKTKLLVNTEQGYEIVAYRLPAEGAPSGSPARR
jgi:hypothetical protein